MAKTTFIIIDAMACLYRAFYAIPLFTTSGGLPTNAVYGYMQTLKKIKDSYKPDYMVVAFDMKGPTFRHEMYEEYKADRPEMPDDLSQQIPYIKDMTKALNMTILEKKGFEADDIIGTLVDKYSSKDMKMLIVTGDKDMYQLVDDNTFILDYAKDKENGSEFALEKFGVRPDQIIDLLSLAGDSSDGIPGVPGVGVKTAAKLLKEYDSFDGIYKNVEEIKGKKLKANLIEFKEQAEFSKELATIHLGVPLKGGLKDYLSKDFDLKTLKPLLMELEFYKFLKEIDPNINDSGESSPAKVVDSESGLKSLVADIKKTGKMGIVGEFDGSGIRCIASALAVTSGKGRGNFVPFFEVMSAGLSEGAVLSKFKDIIEDEKIKKTSNDVKQLLIYFKMRGLEPRGFTSDTTIASYVNNPSGKHDLETLSLSILGEGLENKNCFTLDLKEASFIACKKVEAVVKIAAKLESKLKKDKLKKLYDEMEMPLSDVLCDMEIEGIKVDGAKLKVLSSEMAKELADLEKKIYKGAGEEFNISSPKQLSRVLFESLGLTPIKKTKTGFSTDESVLTALAEEHEIPEMILQYRQVAKLKSTYVDGIGSLIDEPTGRVHGALNQTVTATGRLSSSKPNLQNIPIGGGSAEKIRQAFVAKKGCEFFSADYSQIELRLVAHLSGDKTLINSFKNNEDIHARTASEVFEVDLGSVTKDQRRRAKAINFGILYGMGAYGLSKELNIPVYEAGEYIDLYFEHYPKVEKFLSKVIEDARSTGFTETLYGRRRYLPELNSANDATVKFGERMAVNAPLQGAAADIVKDVMIKIQKRLKAGGFKSKMLLQIHDELLFEVTPDEKDEIYSIVKEEMEGIINLKVPLTVNTKLGKNWALA